MLNEAGNGSIIKGELFEVDDEGLKTLDIIESVAKPKGYTRISTSAKISNGNEKLTAWIYVKERATVDIIHNVLEGEYNLDSRYIPANKR